MVLIIDDEIIALLKRGSSAWNEWRQERGINRKIEFSTNAYLRNFDLSGADFNGVNFSRADLSGVNFSGADLTEANLIGTKLSGANFTGANLTDTVR